MAQTSSPSVGFTVSSVTPAGPGAYPVPPASRGLARALGAARRDGADLRGAEMTESTSGTPGLGRVRRTGRRGPARRAPREALVRAGERLVREGRSVVVVGAPGSGRTYLVGRIVAAVPDLRVLAVRSATSSPGLVVSTVHGTGSGTTSVRAPQEGSARPVATGDLTADTVLGTAGRRTAGSATTGPETTVVLADDAHLLDLDHLQMLCDLASDGKIVLVATSDTAATAAPRSGPAVEALTTLWLDGDAERVELGGLTEVDGHELVRSVAGPRHVDLAARHAILVASAGSPAAIRELTLDVVRSGDGAGATARDLVGGHRSVHLPPRVVERARRRLASLSAAEREALLLLSRLGSFDPERAGRYVGDTMVCRLVQLGCVSPAGSGSALLRANTIDAEAVLTPAAATERLLTEEPVRTGGPVRLGRALRTMVELDAAGLVLEPFECLLLSDAWLDSGVGSAGPSPAATAEQVSRVSTVAARKATAMLQPYRALAHAMLALDTLPTGAAAIEASRALAALGSPRAAHEVLDRTPADAPEEARELVAMWRAELDDWGAPAPESSTVPSVETLRSAVQALRAMDWRVALDLAHSLADDPGAGVVLRLRACGPAGLAAAFLGLGADLETVTTTGQRLHAMLADQVGSASAQQVVDERTVFVAGSTAAHLACSLGWVDLPARLDRLVREAVAARDLAHTSALSTLAGYVALTTGDDATAEVELGAAIERAPRPSGHEAHAWLVSMRATALSRLGRQREADELCASLEAPGATVSAWSTHLLESVRRLGDPASTESAVSPSVLAPEEVALQPTIALFAAAEAAGSSGGARMRRELVDAASTVRQQTDIASLHAVADYVIATSTSDAGTLADLTRTFEDMGMRHLADACVEQALRLLDPDSPQTFTRWRDRADRPVAETGGPGGPGGPHEPLTAREREIAVLAGRGLSNRDIAARLFLSVRTVESHVYLARRKLGAATRRDLAERLDAELSD